MKGMRTNGSYLLSGETLIGAASNTEHHQSYTDLWHRRDKGLQEPSKQGIIQGYNPGELEFCEDCIKGKAATVKFNKARHVINASLDYIHSDLLGPSKVP